MCAIITHSAAKYARSLREICVKHAIIHKPSARLDRSEFVTVIYTDISAGYNAVHIPLACLAVVITNF